MALIRPRHCAKSVEKGSSSMRTCCRNIHLRASDNTSFTSPAFEGFDSMLQNFHAFGSKQADTMMTSSDAPPRLWYIYLLPSPLEYSVQGSTSAASTPVMIQALPLLGIPSSVVHQYHESRFEIKETSNCGPLHYSMDPAQNTRDAFMWSLNQSNSS
jgi:hypothetical protein